MPKRFCQCTSCAYCHAQAGTHGVLFDMDTTKSTKCPGCHQANTTARQQRPNTSTRGYGADHQRIRTALLAKWQPGDPCALCRTPMTSDRDLDLAHNPDRTAWLGLAHQACNRATNQGKR